MHAARFPVLPAACLAGVLALAACGSTRTGARADGTLVIEHRGWRDPVAQTWTLEGAYPGALMKAENLDRVSVTVLGPLGYRTEQLEPARKLQGTLDWTDPQEVMIAVRQRGVSRWTDLPINGRHSVGVAAEAGAEESGVGYFGNLAWNRPSSWVGIGGDDPAGTAPEAASLPAPAGFQPAEPARRRSWYRPWSWFGGDETPQAAPAPGLPLQAPQPVAAPAPAPEPPVGPSPAEEDGR